MTNLQKAIIATKKAHKGQKRLSGESFFHHPLRVAQLLHKYKAPLYVQIAGALHDTLEDTQLSEENIIRMCGYRGLFIVKSLTITEKTKANYFKRLFEKSCENGWCIIVKLIDRLDNIIDMNEFNEDRKKRFIKETLEKIIPIYMQVTGSLTTEQKTIGDKVSNIILDFIDKNFSNIYLIN